MTTMAPRTLTPLAERLRRLDDAVTRVLAAQDSDRRQAMRRYVMALGTQLHTEAEALSDWLDRADRWLTAHPDAADFTKREERWLHRLADYMLIADGLVAARKGLGP